MPTVTVIIPTYNRASMVKGAILSVLDQTYADYEIIVVDDGSTDDTRAVVTALSDKVRYVYQENRGRSNARNHAISLARGKYVAFLDSDDLFLPNKLETQVSWLETEPRFAMVYSSAQCIDENGDSTSSSYVASASGWIYRQVAFYVPLTVLLPTVLIRSEVLRQVGGFDEKMHRFEDTDMWRRVSRDYQVLGLSEVLCKVRTHSGNVIDNLNPDDILRAVDYYVEKVFQEDRDRGTVFLRRGAARFYNHYGHGVLLHPGWRKVARQFARRSLRCWPFQGYAGVLLLCAYLNPSAFSFVIAVNRTLHRHLGGLLRPSWRKLKGS